MKIRKNSSDEFKLKLTFHKRSFKKALFLCRFTELKLRGGVDWRTQKVSLTVFI